jgi:hypothetical protein
MKMTRILFLLLATPLLVVAQPPPLPTALSLSGTWRFQLDRSDTGIQERWFDRSLDGSATLPGGLTEQGVGDAVTAETQWIGGIVDRSWFTAPEYEAYRQPGDVKIPFWLQPELYYAGAAWFQRDLEIPEHWQDRRVVLFLERPHWETRVWLNDRFLGSNNSLATPHEYDLGRLAAGSHRLTVRVDNRMIVDVGENSHSVSDHTQGNWNGIVGHIELRSTPLVWIEELQVFPRMETGSAIVRGRLGNATGEPTTAVVRFPVLRPRESAFRGVGTALSVECPPGGVGFEVEIPIAEGVTPWHEFDPAVYELRAQVGEWPKSHTKMVSFGFREFSTEDSWFTLNGRKLFLRGTLECAIFPQTGHPPTDVAEWRRILEVCQKHGLNHMRFHSWCPPRAAFVAADQLGVYLQVEASSWANQSTTLGDGKPVDDWIYEETERILRAYGNHPSFVLMAYGNEPGGANQREYLVRWIDHFRSQDSRRLYTGASGWPELPENQFHVLPDPRVQAWGAGLNSRINGRPPETMTDYRDFIQRRSVPVISHEIGQWCVYPNFDEMRKYTGYLKPRNFEIFRDRLEASGLGHLARPFLLASGALQALCYKEEIESALRTPGMGGFQLLDLHDFPGQGTALVGVLDPFWEEKGYITPAQFSRFCSSTVPLARLPKRVYTTDETFTASIEFAHFGRAPFREATIGWELVDREEAILARGFFPVMDLPIGNAIPVGRVEVDLRDFPAPLLARLVVRLFGSGYENDWDIWIYPAEPADEPDDAWVTSEFDESALEHLRQGGRVLLTIPGQQVANFDVAPVKPGFSSIFWNTAWTGRQAPTTLGILCDAQHPAFARFPTEGHSNWQWWYIMHRAGALRLDVLPRETKPIVRVIDDWFTARSLGLVVEGRVGDGRLIICGFDLTRDADDPVSRQMRTGLLHYLHSEDCRPAVTFTPEQVGQLITR